MHININQNDDAGGAIMKKLYRIHSRHILEIDERINIDITLQEVMSPRKKQKMDRDGNGNGRVTMGVNADTNVLQSMFHNKNNIADYEEMIEKGLKKMNQENKVNFL